jgi:hypothetical protein
LYPFKRLPILSVVDFFPVNNAMNESLEFTCTGCRMAILMLSSICWLVNRLPRIEAGVQAHPGARLSPSEGALFFR